MKKINLLVLLAAALHVVAPGSGMKAAAQRLLDSAVNEERALEELSAMYERIARRQADSGVYRENEIGTVSNASTKLDEVRVQNMTAIIAMLQDRDGRAQRNALIGKYQSTSEHLHELYNLLAEDVVNDITRRDLLRQQQLLLDELQAFREALENEEISMQDSLERLAEMAESQEQLATSADEDLGELMMDAARNIQTLEIDEGIATQQEIVDRLREELAMDEMDYPDMEMAERLQELLARLQDMRDQLEHSLENPMDMEQRQDLAMEMDEAAEQSAEIFEAMMEAILEMMQEHDEEAMHQVEEAMQLLQQQYLAMADQQPQMGAPDGEESMGPALQAERTPLEQAARDDWSTRLPERERDALLSARQARYSVEMEDSVRRYFVNIAQ